MNRHRIIFASVFALVLMLTFALFAGAAYANGVGQCFGGTEDAKYDGVGPHSASAPAGMVITEVAIKTGKLDDGGFCLFYAADSNDGCYVVNGIGTDKVDVSRIGDGSDCKEISHIEVKYGTAGGGGEPPVNGGEPPVSGGGEPPADEPIAETGGTAQTTTAAPASVTALPSTGLAIALPLAGLGLAGAGLLLRRRS